MSEKVKQMLDDRTSWIFLGCVLAVIVVTLLAMLNHEKEKPDSPQALAAAAFNRIIDTREWKPGMGPQPFMYHPAAGSRLVWQPLPPRGKARGNR